jgi:hypothetical protein
MKDIDDHLPAPSGLHGFSEEDLHQLRQPFVGGWLDPCLGLAIQHREPPVARHLADQILAAAATDDEAHTIARIRAELAESPALVAAIVQVVLDPGPANVTPVTALVAFEALAGARIPRLEGIVAGLVEVAAGSGNPDMRFAALAAVGDLPEARRRALALTLRALLDDEDGDVAAAAATLVREGPPEGAGGPCDSAR